MEGDDVFMELFMTDLQLVEHIQSAVASRLPRRGTDLKAVEAAVEAAVNETFAALKLKEMVQISRDLIRSSTERRKYGRKPASGSSSSRVKKQSATASKIRNGGGGLSSKSVDDLMKKTIRPQRIMSSTLMDVGLTRKLRGSSRSPCSPSDLAIIENVGKADAELDAKLMSSPQLKEVLSRAKRASASLQPGERPFQASFLEDDDNDDEDGDNAPEDLDGVFDEFLNVKRLPEKKGKKGGGGIVRKNIDFGKRQRFDYAFPDFEQDAEFDSVDEWLRARDAYKEKKRVTSIPTEDYASSGEGKEVVVSTPSSSSSSSSPSSSSSSSSPPKVMTMHEKASATRGMRPKISEEPEIKSLRQCGSGVYIGAELLINIDSPRTAFKGFDDVADYADDFESFPSSSSNKRVHFAAEVVSDTFLHRTKYTPEEVSTLFYTHDEAYQFQADYSYEIYRAESLGLTWEAWWEAREQEDVEREEEEERERQAQIRDQNLENGLDLQEIVEELDVDGEENPFQFE